MTRVTVLGGAGVVGKAAVRYLSRSEVFDEVVVADLNRAGCEAILSELKSERLSAAYVDCSDKESLREVIRDSSMVLNFVGPFFRWAPRIARTVIEEGVNYVDICDDTDATEALLEMDEEAKRACVTVLVGMGAAPGITNVVAKMLSDMLDETDEIVLYNVHGGESEEGLAVLYHRVHIVGPEVIKFEDGRMVRVKTFEEGRAEEEEVRFPDPVGTVKVYLRAHPEVITFPRFIKGVKTVKSKGAVLPEPYYDLVRDFVRLGLTSEAPINVKGQEISPLDFAVSYLKSVGKPRYASLLTEPKGCLKLVVKGKEKGEPREYQFCSISRGFEMAEATAIPAALAAEFIAGGKIEAKGVLPPEACVPPMEFLGTLLGTGELKGATAYIESIDKEGRVIRVWP